MPLICAQHLPRVERSATVPLPAICEDEKLPAVLVHFPSVGGSAIMIDVNYRPLQTGSLPSCTLCIFYALLKGYAHIGEG